MPPETPRAPANQAESAVVKAPFIDTEALPKHFDSAVAEQRWDAQWQSSGIYHYDGTRPRAETFVVDTPPPTVSGSLHVGHVFSYTQPDVVVRFPARSDGRAAQGSPATRVAQELHRALPRAHRAR
jgi:isoleucyl-tRNA synthetase